jgi:hypothetical protein
MGRPKDNYKSKTDKFLEIGVKAIGKLNLYMGGISLNHIKVKADYREYLGEDWECTYEGACSYIGNHTSWMDIIIHQSLHQVCFTAKDGTKKIPFVGPIS